MTTANERPLTREATAHLEVGHTDASPATIRFLVAAFLLLIALVPIFEMASARLLPRDGSAVWTHLSSLRHMPAGGNQSGPEGGIWAGVVATNRAVLAALHDFEEALEDESQAGRSLRPSSQVLMTRLGAGNELAYIGRDGWLFYRPDVEYVTGPGFLDRGTRARRVASASEWTVPPQTDPRAAILEFKRQLDARGIALVVVPTPVKPSIHPERLAWRTLAEAAPLQNASYGELLNTLQQDGVLVFDPSHTIAEAVRATLAPQYLETDTHWRPETMELVAERLAEFVRAHAALPPIADPGYVTRGTEVQNLGDVAVMLDLPPGQQLYAREDVAVRQVVEPDGTPWRPSRTADVLVLGDSFSNIYSLASMGWGEAAGFVEHLSRALNRPADRIVQNADGAYATRELLARAGPRRLAGKRVVVWQFATRELAFGDWKLFEAPPDQATRR